VCQWESGIWGSRTDCRYICATGGGGGGLVKGRVAFGGLGRIAGIFAPRGGGGSMGEWHLGILDGIAVIFAPHHNPCSPRFGHFAVSDMTLDQIAQGNQHVES